MRDPKEHRLLDHGPWIQKGLEHGDPSDASVKPLHADRCVLCPVKGSHFPAGVLSEGKCSPGSVSKGSLVVDCFGLPVCFCGIIQTYMCPGFVFDTEMKYHERKQFKEERDLFQLTILGFSLLHRS